MVAFALNNIFIDETWLMDKHEVIGSKRFMKAILIFMN